MQKIDRFTVRISKRIRVIDKRMTALEKRVTRLENRFAAWKLEKGHQGDTRTHTEQF